MEILLSLLTFAGGLLGVGAFGSALVNVGKELGLVKDGQAPTFIAGYNLLVLIALFYFKASGTEIDFVLWDSKFTIFANVVVALGQLVAVMGGSALFYKLTRGAKVIGKSYTLSH